MKNITVNIYHEVIIPAGIELEVEATVEAGSDGYFDHVTGDCDPPHGPEVEVQNRELLVAQIEQWFDHQKREAVEQFERYLASGEFKEKAEETIGEGE